MDHKVEEVVKPKVNLEEVQPLDVEVVITYINNFVLRNVEFFNHFAHICEEKVYEVAKKIQRLEISVSLLEAKLESIPEAQSAASADLSDVSHMVPSREPPTPPLQPTEVSAGDEPEAIESAAPEPESTPGQILWKNDPRYQGFFKLLKIGVSIPQLRPKIIAAGLDPDVLENPDGVSDYQSAPVSTEAAEMDADSDSSMSSDSE